LHGEHGGESRARRTLMVPKVSPDVIASLAFVKVPAARSAQALNRKNELGT
jgi:hypothetical protein